MVERLPPPGRAPSRALADTQANQDAASPPRTTAARSPTQQRGAPPTLPDGGPKVHVDAAHSSSLLSPRSKRQLSKAPPSFPLWDAFAVFVDIQRVNLDVTFDVRAKKATVVAKVELVQPAAGHPVLDLDRVPSKALLNGRALPPGALSSVSDPDNESRFRALRQKLEPGRHQLELHYDFEEGVKWLDGGVFFLSHMGDFDPPGFSEQFFPSNFEYDQYATDMTVRIKGADHVPRLLVNGTSRRETDGDTTTYEISLPEWYNTASLFLKIHNPEKYAVASRSFHGAHGETPVTAVVRQGPEAPQKLKEALDRSTEAMAELEGHLGAFPHDGYIVYVSGFGGMEHSGATRTSMRALSHETCHQWIARGALPAGGNHGWLDEGIASWRDDGYPRASSASIDGAYPQLSGFSAYRRYAPRESYSHGSAIMSELDFIFRQRGGLLPQLGDFMRLYRHETYTTEMWISFLDSRWPPDAAFSAREYFDAKVYGKSGLLEPAAAAAYAELTDMLREATHGELAPEHAGTLQQIGAFRSGHCTDEHVRTQLKTLPTHLREPLLDQFERRN